MGSSSAFLAGGLLFSEETTEDILDHRAELTEEIEGLTDEVHRLFGIKNMPKQIGICRVELERLEVKKKVMETEIDNLYEEKKEQLTHCIEEEAKKFKGRNEKYRKAGEALRGEIKALHVEKKDIEESITLKQAELEKHEKNLLHAAKIEADILKNAKTILEEADDIKKEAESEKKAHKEVLLDLNSKQKTFNEKVMDFDKEKEATVIFLEEAKKSNEKKEKELTSNLEKRREEIDRQNAECKVSRREIEAIGEHQEIERDELRAWRLALDKREEVTTKREEDLDTNWTIFEQAKGGK